MDRGAWQATIHGVAKEMDMTERLNNSNTTTIRRATGKYRQGPYTSNAVPHSLGLKTYFSLKVVGQEPPSKKGLDKVAFLQSKGVVGYNKKKN